MSNYLTMRPFVNQRAPTIDKVRRDAENMYDYSRYVIVLDEDGNIKERVNRVTGCLGEYLVIIAPVLYNNETVNSVVLEIGLSRSTPYMQFEKFVCEKTIAIKNRRPIAKLVNKKITDLLPTLAEILEKIVDEDTKHRKSLIWLKNGKDKKTLLNGMFITIPHEAEPLVYVCLEKDMDVRVSGHLSLFAALTREKLSKFKYAFYPKGLKRFKDVQDIVMVLNEAVYPESFLNIIKEKLGKRTKKVRALFEQILDEFDIKTKEKNDLDILYEKLLKKFGKDKKSLIESFDVSLHNHHKRNIRRVVHARNCLRVEIHPSKEAIARKHHPETLTKTEETWI